MPDEDYYYHICKACATNKNITPWKEAGLPPGVVNTTDDCKQQVPSVTLHLQRGQHQRQDCGYAWFTTAVVCVDDGDFYLTDINYADDAVLFTDDPTKRDYVFRNFEALAAVLGSLC